jgi:hypothetical protein
MDQAWAQKYGFNFSLSLMPDEGAWAPLKGDARSQKVVADMKDTMTRYGQSPVYQRLNGKPLVFDFPKLDSSTPNGKVVSADTWKAALDATPFHLVMENNNAGYKGVADSVYSWVQLGKNPQDYNPAYLDWIYKTPPAGGNQLPNVVGTVYAGFDDSGVHAWSHDPNNKRQMDRTINGQSTLDLTWQKVNQFNQANPNRPITWVQQNTWNDWNEGTEIEPSKELGFAPLEDAARQNANFKGQLTPDLADAEKFALRYLELRHAGKTDDDLAAGLMAFAARDYARALSLLPA